MNIQDITIDEILIVSMVTFWSAALIGAGVIFLYNYCRRIILKREFNKLVNREYKV